MNLSKNETIAILGISFSALVIIALTKGKNAMEYLTNWVWDSVSEKRINNLHPLVQDPARIAINELDTKFGIKVRVTRTIVTEEGQNKLYAKGRTEPGAIVTNAKGTETYHFYALALDVVEMVNGQPDWNSPNWEIIGQVFEKYGFEWGGRWKRFTDKPHMQMTFLRSIAELQARHAANNYDANGNINLA